MEGVLEIFIPSTAMTVDGDLAVLKRQAAVLRSLGLPFIATLLEAGDRQLGRAPRTAALIAAWPGDAAAAGLAMRFNGALHALARQGRSTDLAELLRREHGDFDRAVGGAMAADDDFITAWMRAPPQTNEVARAGAIMAALMVVATMVDMPVALLELGSSAGLNLNLGQYRFDLGHCRVGPGASPVLIAPAWRGASPPDGKVRIIAARGVDLHPLDVADAAARERLSSFVWTDDPARVDRLERAIALARASPPAIDCGDLVEWLPRQLAVTQLAGICRVVFHSMVLQYCTLAERAAIAEHIRSAGVGADRNRPLAWISFEWTECRSEVQLILTRWPDGTSYHLATCHPYCEWIRWHYQ